MNNPNTAQVELATIYKQFAYNITDMQHDIDVQAMHQLAQQGLNLALTGEALTPLDITFIKTAVFFNPGYAPDVVRTLGDFVANTGDQAFINLHQKIAAQYKLPVGQVFETSTSLVQKPSQA